MTSAPTITSAGSKINVIPSSATLTVDCRVPPGHARETAAALRLREVIGHEDGYEVTWLEEAADVGFAARAYKAIALELLG